MEKTDIMESITIASIISNSSKGEAESCEEPDIPCIVCDDVLFPATDNGVKSPLLAHLLSEHKIVIAEVQNIAHFSKYIRYWKERLASVHDLTEVCVVINSNSAPTDIDPQEKFFLLTDFLPEDHKLRDQLTNEKLTTILDIHLAERTDTNFKRKCLFCKNVFTGNRSSLFRHMASEHSFNLGNADNIVNAAELLDSLQLLLDNYQCLFCENQFKDWSMLKDHMRKKGHKRIDPHNKEYDKFYLINYVAPGKNWKDLQRDPEYEKEEEEENNEADTAAQTEKEWSDWMEQAPLTLCLWCTHTDMDTVNVIDHMRDVHKFDMVDVKRALDLGFYHQVKAVNFIRRQVYLNTCPYCLEPCDSNESLTSHLEKESHYRLPSDMQAWNQPQYFFPTFEDDSLLCFLEDDAEEEEEEEEEEEDNREEEQGIEDDNQTISLDVLAHQVAEHTLNEP